MSWLGIDGFASPALHLWLFLAVALLVLPLLLLRREASRGRSARLAWPDLDLVTDAPLKRRDGWSHVARLLRGSALALLALVLAEPVERGDVAPRALRGLDLMLVLDTSPSMRALDMDPAFADPSRDPRPPADTPTRLDVARSAVARFAEVRAAEGDRVGLVVFAERAHTALPLSSDPALLASALDDPLRMAEGGPTALGDALALGVKRLERGGDRKLVVLLSDGRSNAGAIPVRVATALARSAGIRVHTVALGTAPSGASDARVWMRTAQGPRLERHEGDAATLARIAERTGGRFFQAPHAGALDAVYAEIDASERNVRRAAPRAEEKPRPEPLLAAAGLLVVVEIALGRVLTRRLP